MTATELMQLMTDVFPQARPERFRIESVGEGGHVVFRYLTTDEDIRPGNTIAGPVLMAVSDLAVYLSVLSAIGPIPLAVTTNLNINFLRKPGTGELVVEARLLKLGKQLAVGEAYVRSVDGGTLVSHATVTYSIPPDPSRA